MTPHRHSPDLTRRQLFTNGAIGLGLPALASLLAKDLSAADSASQSPKQFGGLPELPHHAPKVKSVIYLLQNGAPPHVDTFDYKPQMEKFRGQELPESFHKNQRLSTMTQRQKSKAVLPALTPFKQYGECGRWIGDFMPHIGSIVDEATFIKSMHTTQVNYAPAITFFLTGNELPGRPSMGAWARPGFA